MAVRTPMRKGGKRSRLRMPLICLAATVVLLGAGVFLSGFLSPENLTDEQVLAKTAWTEDELAASAAQRMQARRRGEARPEVMRHLQEQIQKLPAERQRAVRDQIVTATVEAGLREYRLLAAEKQKDVVQRLAEQARRRQAEIAKGQVRPLPGADAAAGPDQNERKEAAARAMRQILDRLTPQERTDLAPVVKEWVKMAETL